MFEGNALISLSECKNICMLGDSIFLQVGVTSYTINIILTVIRIKRFYPDYNEELDRIDSNLKLCAKLQQKSKDDTEVIKMHSKMEKKCLIKEVVVTIVLVIAVFTAFYVDIFFLEK